MKICKVCNKRIFRRLRFINGYYHKSCLRKKNQALILKIIKETDFSDCIKECGVDK